jgi:hypothetical protein
MPQVGKALCCRGSLPVKFSPLKTKEHAAFPKKPGIWSKACLLSARLLTEPE